MTTSTERVTSVQIVTSVLCWVVCFLVLFVAWDLFKKRRILRFSKEIKGYRFYPIIGNVYHIIGENIFTGIQKVIKKYNLPCSLWLGHNYNYIIADVMEVKVILNHPNTFDKSSPYEDFKCLFGDTLLMVQFQNWKRNRKIFAKSFSQPILNSFVEVFYKKSCTLVGILKESHNRDKYDIFEKLSLDNFCANVMQLDLDSQLSEDSELSDILNRLHEYVGRRMVTSYFYPYFIWFLTPEGKSYLKDLSRVKGLIYEMIQKKRTTFKESIEFRDGQKLPLMDMLLEAEGVTFSDEEIFQEILLFVLAATDTSGITLTFTFTLLGMNPEAQEKVYQEVKQYVGNNNSINHHDLLNLKYTERAINESMRLLPVIPMLGRQVASGSDDIDLGARKIPAGSNIIISVFDLHRSKSYWKNPLEYNPDRFLPEEVAKRDPYSFIPFSGGPRNCIGKKYAMMMMITTVAHVIRNFEVRSKYKSVEEMEFSSCITMKTIHELDCHFIPRTH